MTKLKLFWSNNKDFRVLCYTMLNALILYLIKVFWNVTDPNLLAVAPFLIAIMNLGTKWINTKLLGDLWVDKPTEWNV